MIIHIYYTHLLYTNRLIYYACNIDLIFCMRICQGGTFMLCADSWRRPAQNLGYALLVAVSPWQNTSCSYNRPQQPLRQCVAARAGRCRTEVDKVLSTSCESKKWLEDSTTYLPQRSQTCSCIPLWGKLCAGFRHAAKPKWEKHA